MDFGHFLSAYYPDTRYGGDRLYADMIVQAQLAEQLGYRAVTIPEHHLINILMIPDPLQMAVKIASVTQRLELVTSVCVLPLHDMRVFAGRLILAEILCERRLIVGVGRGAFAYELARLDRPVEESRERFDESLDVLLALLTREEVSWEGKYYRFAPLTVMPRPVSQAMPPIMIAALAPQAIEASVRRGFHVQTSPLDASLETVRTQVGAFLRGRQTLGAQGAGLRLSLLRVGCIARNEADAHRKSELAYSYYQRFHNVFTGPGIVERGAIKPLPLQQTLEQLRENILICTADEMIERLKRYEELGVDELVLNSNIGLTQQEVLESMRRFADEVMPHFRRSAAAAPSPERVL